MPSQFQLCARHAFRFPTITAARYRSLFPTHCAEASAGINLSPSRAGGVHVLCITCRRYTPRAARASGVDGRRHSRLCLPAGTSQASCCLAVTAGECSQSPLSAAAAAAPGAARGGASDGRRTALMSAPLPPRCAALHHGVWRRFTACVNRCRRWRR